MTRRRLWQRGVNESPTKPGTRCFFFVCSSDMNAALSRFDFRQWVSDDEPHYDVCEGCQSEFFELNGSRPPFQTNWLKRYQPKLINFTLRLEQQGWIHEHSGNFTYSRKFYIQQKEHWKTVITTNIITQHGVIQSVTLAAYDVTKTCLVICAV